MRRILTLLKGLLVGLFAIAPRPALGASQTRAIVHVFDGWGDPSGFVVTGRVLEDQGMSAPDAGAAEAHNLVDNLKALESDEVRGADLRVSIHGASYTATTDEDGNFRVQVQGLRDTMMLPAGRVDVVVEVVGPATVQAKPGAGAVFVHALDAPFVAVISDLDDTVVKTHVTSKRKLLSTVLLKNAAQLEPVEGASENYRAAQAAGVTAFFYLSGSPQNLQPRLRAFLERNQFPAGPLLLKNIGDDALLKQQGYKGNRLTELLERFPRMRVILVGDSGERDPEIYRAIRDKHPDRVVAIVIRKTAGADADPARFVGCTVVDDKYPRSDVIAALAAEKRSGP